MYQKSKQPRQYALDGTVAPIVDYLVGGSLDHTCWVVRTGRLTFLSCPGDVVTTQEGDEVNTMCHISR